VPKTHFLRQLKELIDWEKLTEGLADCYKGGAEYGPIPYHPAVLFKMLLLSYLYKLSERQTEEFANDSVGARYFLGLAAHQSAPDHSSLSVFKEQILERKGPEAFEELVKGVVCLAKEKGIIFGRIQVVDATPSIADVDVRKDDERGERGGFALEGSSPKGRPGDGDAAWGTKGRKKVKTAEGKTVLVNKAFYGYKAHLSLNAESGLITSVVSTAGNESDGEQFMTLVENDEAVGIKGEIYAGDKGYDDGDNHQLLWAKGKQSALCLKGYRTEKKDGNKGLWLRMKDSEGY
jgi:IS5 family transposase